MNAKKEIKKLIAAVKEIDNAEVFDHIARTAAALDYETEPLVNEIESVIQTVTDAATGFANEIPMDRAYRIETLDSLVQTLSDGRCDLEDALDNARRALESVEDLERAIEAVRHALRIDDARLVTAEKAAMKAALKKAAAAAKKVKKGARK